MLQCAHPHAARSPVRSLVCPAGTCQARPTQHIPTAGLVDSGFEQGLVSGFLLILFSELGDKTFFIALLLALKQNKGIVFAGTFGALAVMTVISVNPDHCDCTSKSSQPKFPARR